MGVGAVRYMHDIHHIAHRDLKPENFLFEIDAPIEQNQLKLIDFGLSKVCPPGQYMTSLLGTPYYVAPEVLQKRYTEACDNWAVGVIIYILLCGYPPFRGRDDRDTLALIKLGNVNFDPKEWSVISADAKDLILRLLTKDVRLRLSARQVLDHVWVKETAPKALGNNIGHAIVNNLKSFRIQHRLKKVSLHIMASQLDNKALDDLRKAFEILDQNKDGILTAAELQEGIANAGLGDIQEDLKQILAEVDSDGSGSIDYTEFLAAALDRRMYIQEDICWAAFRVFDKNGDGTISPDELEQVLGTPDVKHAVGSNTIKKLMAEIDINGDGSIDFAEFMAMMRSQGMD